MLSESKYEKWAKQFKTVQRMFDRLASKKSGSKATERTYSRSLQLWHVFSGLNPDETVAKWESEAKEQYDKALEDWDVKLDLFVKWLCDKGFTKNVASNTHAAVKSLIKYNSRLKLAIGTPSSGVVEGLKPLTIEEFKKLDTVANIQQKWLLRGLKDSGMSREDFIELTYGNIKRDYEKGEQFIHIDVIRRKEGVKYETFLGPNAAQVLNIYLDIRRKRGETITDSTRLLVQDIKPYEKLALNSVTKTVVRLGEKVGIKASPHRLRKMFETYMALEVRHPVILRYWMGHKLKMSDIEARYVIPNETMQKDLYMQAYKHLDITEATVERRVKAIEEIVSGLTPEQKDLMQKYGIRLAQKAKRRTEHNGGDCGETFEQINESQLLAYLKAGWSIVKELQSGDIIVKR
jgi:hypothetical protein